MRPAATRRDLDRTLHVAFELGNVEWKLAMAPSVDEGPWIVTIAARSLPELQRQLARAKAHFGLPATAPVASCYEAGRDGFWLHRALVHAGIQNLVVDSASIEVSRRRRRAKTDRLDATKLVTMLLRARAGERKVWSVLRVPSLLEEDRRQLPRELLRARRDRTRHTNRIRGLLASQGLVPRTLAELPDQLREMHLWDGSPVPPWLQERVRREWATVEHYRARIAALEQQRRDLLRTSDEATVRQVRQLHQLRGVGWDSACLYVFEFFGWRAFQNRRQVGGLAGLTGTPYQSGDVRHEQGISKAGNRWVRTLAINSAWAWLRYQPESALAQWYQRQFGSGPSRMRKIGIVALARKLLIAFWRYLDQGLVPEGAVFRT
jgi:transposase